MLGFNGGLLGKRRVPTVDAASGLWFPNEQSVAKSGSVWPSSGDPNFSSVSLLLHMNGSNGSTVFTDNSSNAVAVTANGNAQISTAESKFGGASCFLNGTSDSLTFTDPALGTGDFTIEMWVKTNSSVQYAQLIGNETASAGYSLLINNNSTTGGQIALYIGSLIASTSTGDWSDNSWHHVAVTRSGTSVTIWVDGTSNGTGTSSASMNGSSLCYVGRNNQFSPRNITGYIDDLRITKGVARYTANFTAPIAPFPDY
jgi:hypothetical protein